MNDEYTKMVFDQEYMEMLKAYIHTSNQYQFGSASASPIPVNIDQYICKVSVDVDTEMHTRHMHDQAYKAEIRQRLNSELSDIFLKKSKYTQIKVANPTTYMDSVRVTASCVILSIEEFENIIKRNITNGI